MSLNYKILLVGDGGVGKTTWINRHRTGEFEKKYIATQGVDVTPLTFNTNYGPVTFKVWDCAGQEKFGGIRTGYYTGAQGAIVMFDLTSKVTHTNVSRWIEPIDELAPGIPIVLCGNKCDIPVIGRIAEQDLPNVDYCQISARSNLNFEKPWLNLARRLTKHSDLEFTDMPAITPPEVIVSKPQLSVSLPTPTYKYVNMISLPDGGVMKITHEYYPNTDILKY
jgi:GTP-binding nuclear protein Ran